MLVNRLVGEIGDARYLEIGSGAGSTLCTAVSGNAVSATAIGDRPLGGDRRRELFMRNAGRFLGAGAKLTTSKAISAPSITPGSANPTSSSTPALIVSAITMIRSIWFCPLSTRPSS